LNPIAQFHNDRAQARRNRDPCAELCALATVNAEGAPEVRTLVLRDLDSPAEADGEARLAVFINDSSPKWPALGQASALAYFPTLKIQYRLSCATEPVPESLVQGHWRKRPSAPKKMDWYYARRAQSSTVPSRAKLLEEVDGLALPEPLIAPPSARGLYLVPFAIERLDLNQPDGIHDRRRWRRQAADRPSPFGAATGKRQADSGRTAAILESDWTESILVP